MMGIAEGIYVLCALTSATCAFLLLRGFTRSRVRLLFWSSLCFVGLALNNVLLVADVMVVPGLSLGAWRGAAALAGLLPLLFGLVWES
jgi:hypothetical protein